jgi:peptidoglycan/xylan/chitin deacetylase (PgdA/CDA1 family)
VNASVAGPAIAVAAGAVGAVAVAQALPALSSIAPMRNRLLPGLAGRGTPDHIALTFDDGPDPASTPLFLDLLAERGVKATFFLLGFMIERSPGLAKEIEAAGHEVALHGYTHRVMLRRGWASTRDDLRRGFDLIADTVGRAPRWYRPPYGVVTASARIAAGRLGMRTVLWTAWGRDWTARATPDSVQSLVQRDLRGGGTILLHDSDCTSKPQAWRSTLGAVPRLLDTIAARGWRVGPLGEHGLSGAAAPAGPDGEVKP